MTLFAVTQRQASHLKSWNYHLNRAHGVSIANIPSPSPWLIYNRFAHDCVAIKTNHLKSRRTYSLAKTTNRGAIELSYNCVAHIDRVARATNRGAISAIRAIEARSHSLTIASRMIASRWQQIAARSRLSQCNLANRDVFALTYDRVAYDRVALATNRGAIAVIAARSRQSRRDRAHLRSRRAWSRRVGNKSRRDRGYRGAIAVIAARSRQSRRDRAHLRSRRAWSRRVGNKS